jgi:dephospho-CoA kinase
METGNERRHLRVEDSVAVGLTGGMAAGKSTALCLFAEAGAVTVSADAVVHELYARPAVAAALRERFGAAVFCDDGALDRRALGACVATDREALGWLERLIHPLVAREFDLVLATAESHRIVVIEIPLLFEAHLQGLFDLVVTIEAPRELRTARAAARDDSRVFAVLDAEQVSSEQRLSASDLGYVNDGDLAGLRAFVAKVMARAAALRQVAHSPRVVS